MRRIHFVRTDLGEYPNGAFLRWARWQVTLHDASCKFCQEKGLIRG